MRPVKRLEIVINALQADTVIGLLERHGITAYSVFHDVTGRGDRGAQRGDELTGAFSNSCIVTACAPERLEAVVAALGPYLRRAGGMALVSDAAWVEH